MLVKRILIIEDDESWQEIIADWLEPIGGVEIHTASSYGEARRLITSGLQFGLLIIDPGLPSDNEGIQLLNILADQDVHIPAIVVSVVDESDIRAKIHYRVRHFIQKRYLDGPEFRREVRTTLEVTTQPMSPISGPTVEPGLSPSSLSGSRIDFVLVTTLSEERDAVLDKLPGYSQLPPAKDDIRTYFQADLPVTFSDNSAGIYHIIVMCLLGMGRVQAVAATVDAIRRWHPRYIVLIGIAGGIAARSIQIGDILISDQVVDYELQKLAPDGPEVRWDVQRADTRLLNACNNFRSASWQELIKIKRPDRGKPSRHTGPIASGDKVIAFSDVLARYQDVWPKLLGVEMEAAGVATATVQSPDRPGFFMVRGVSDLADENKGSSDVKKWRSYACDAAASFAIALLQSGPVPLSDEDIQVKTKQVQLIIEGEFSEFSLNRQQDIVGVLAVLLKIDPSNVRVLQVYQGSIVVLLELPDSAADRLHALAATQDFRIKTLGIRSVLVENKEVIELADKTVMIPDVRPEQSPLEKEGTVMPTSILVVFANPKGSDPLRLQAENRIINECIKLGKHRENLSLKICSAATIDDVRRVLLEQDYHIVQFSGHASPKGLSFENEIGEPQFVPQDALAKFMSRYSPPVQCVILNACYTIGQGNLVSMGVPFTVAMDGPISDDAAKEFTRGFYDAIGAGKDIHFAYEEGCSAMALKGYNSEEEIPKFLEREPGKPEAP